MRVNIALGAALIILGILLLFLLRNTLIRIIILEFVGILLAISLIIGGLFLILGPRVISRKAKRYYQLKRFTMQRWIFQPVWENAHEPLTWPSGSPL